LAATESQKEKRERKKEEEERRGERERQVCLSRVDIHSIYLSIYSCIC